MADARARGWGWPGAPGSAEDKAYQRDHLTWVTLNCGVRLRLRREVAHLFKGFFDELEAETGYSLADKGVPDDWGFNNRDIRGRPGVKSNHAWGLAADGNSEENPMGSPRRTNYPVDAAHRLSKKWGLFWGYDYQTRPDTMHFEFIQRPADVGRYPLGGAAPHAATPTTTPQEDDDVPTDRGTIKKGEEDIILFPLVEGGWETTLRLGSQADGATIRYVVGGAKDQRVDATKFIGKGGRVLEEHMQAGDEYVSIVNDGPQPVAWYWEATRKATP